MTLRPRKREIDVMSSILDQEGILEDVAAHAVRAAFDMLLERELWLVVTVYEDALWVHGPYFTRNQAVKAVASTEIAPQPGTGGRAFIRRLITSTADGSEDETLF
jgi:hypothetical protein